MDQVSDDELDHGAEEDSDKEDQDLDKMFGAWLGELDKLTQVGRQAGGNKEEAVSMATVTLLILSLFPSNSPLHFTLCRYAALCVRHWGALQSDVVVMIPCLGCVSVFADFFCLFVCLLVFFSFIIESGWWSATKSTAEAASQAGDEHSQLLLPLLYVQHKWWDSGVRRQHNKNNFLINWVPSIINLFPPPSPVKSFHRGSESGRHRRPGCPHGRPLLHRARAQHHLQTKLSVSQPEQGTTEGPRGPQCQHQASWHQWRGKQRR